MVRCHVLLRSFPILTWILQAHIEPSPGTPKLQKPTPRGNTGSEQGAGAGPGYDHVSHASHGGPRRAVEVQIASAAPHKSQNPQV